MTVAISQQNPALATANYKNLSSDEKLVFLWYAYLKVKLFLKPTLQNVEAGKVAEELFRQMEKISFTEQEKVEREIIEGKDGLICNICAIRS